jgi:hypothetical protein
MRSEVCETDITVINVDMFADLKKNIRKFKQNSIKDFKFNTVGESKVSISDIKILWWRKL